MDAARVIAQALLAASATVITNVPGYGGTQVIEALEADTHVYRSISFHEEVAYTIAHGASLAGSRSAALVKTHGFGKAVNSVIDSLASGVGAGFVCLVFDDKQGKHSDSLLDPTVLLRGTEIPFRVLPIENIYDEIQRAFAWSESLQLPVALVIDSDDLAKPAGEFLAGSEDSSRPHPTKRARARFLDPQAVARHVVCPQMAGYQRQVLEARLADEDWRSIPPPPLPSIPEALPPGWQAAARVFEPVFTALRALREAGVIGAVAGDTSTATLFAFPPYHCVDYCTYMGGSLPLAIGMQLAGWQDTWAITGDFAFIAAGHLGLIEAVQREVPLKVLILNNHRARATGGQPVPDGVLERLLAGYEGSIQSLLEPSDTEKVQRVLEAACQAPGMQIVLADYTE